MFSLPASLMHYHAFMDRTGASSWNVPPTDPHNLDRPVGRLVQSILNDERICHISTAPLPHRGEIRALIDRLSWVLFPGFVGPRDLTKNALQSHIASVVAEINDRLVTQITAALQYEEQVVATRSVDSAHADIVDRARNLAAEVITALPGVRDVLSLDVQAAFDGDPAATHTDEVIFCYPGLWALAVHRVAHQMYRLGIPLLPRIMSEIAHGDTGIDIHPGARIGHSFFIDHGTGVVIGESSIIGDHCRLYQGVTLGAKSFPKDEGGRIRRGEKRHPTLEDHVTVYAGAAILGGDTIIGAGSVINGGVFITTSIPAGHVVRAPRVELTLRNNPELPPANYAI